MKSSPEARPPATPSRGAKGVSFGAAPASVCEFLLGAAWCLVGSIALAQAGAQTTPAPTPAPQSEAQQTSELASHDEPTTFKVNVKLVVVRMVVRDAQGRAVGNLHQEDFQVFDKGKPQAIAQFDVEQPGALAAKIRQESEKNSDAPPGDASSSPANAAAVPERFVAYLFDD